MYFFYISIDSVATKMGYNNYFFSSAKKKILFQVRFMFIPLELCILEHFLLLCKPNQLVKIRKKI